MVNYKRAPIVEAVIEFRVSSLAEPQELDKLRDKMVDGYPLPITPLQHLGTHISGDALQVQFGITGFRLTGPDGDEIAIIQRQGLSIAKLAPYTQWEFLRDRFGAAWKLWKEETGKQQVSRIGVRYINRIDIPQVPNDAIDLSKYVRIYPAVPNGPLSTLRNFQVLVQASVEQGNWQTNVTVQSAPAALVGTNAMVLDIDVYNEGPIPQRENELFALLEEARPIKNAIFENCITDETRRLIG